MRTFNAFKLVAGRIEYTDKIKAAVLDPRMTGLNVHLNGGFDWIDDKYRFIKLLLSRGQIAHLTTHQDLLARTDYMDAIALGRGLKTINFDCANAPIFGVDRDKKRAAWASEKRMRAAHQRFTQQMMQQQVGA